MNNHINLKLSDEQVSFLKKTAITNELVKNKDEPSLSKALKFILENHMQNNNDQMAENNQKLSRIEHMLEQVHVTIPHILYHSRYSSSYCNYSLRLNKVSEPERCVFGERIVENVYQICGDFQTYQYQTIYLSLDNKNMNIMPIEKDKNKWKLN